jgi:hypothetical protein
MKDYDYKIFELDTIVLLHVLESYNISNAMWGHLAKSMPFIPRLSFIQQFEQGSREWCDSDLNVEEIPPFVIIIF